MIYKYIYKLGGKPPARIQDRRDISFQPKMDHTILAGLGQTLCSVLSGLKLNSEPVFTLESTSGRIHLDIVWSTGRSERTANPTESTEKKKRKSPSTRRRDKRRREAWLARKSGDASQPQPDTSASPRNPEAEATEKAEPKQDLEVSLSPRIPEAKRRKSTAASSPAAETPTPDDEGKRLFSEPHEINDEPSHCRISYPRCVDSENLCIKCQVLWDINRGFREFIAEKTTVSSENQNKKKRKKKKTQKK